MSDSAFERYARPKDDNFEEEESAEAFHEWMLELDDDIRMGN